MSDVELAFSRDIDLESGHHATAGTGIANIITTRPRRAPSAAASILLLLSTCACGEGDTMAEPAPSAPIAAVQPGARSVDRLEIIDDKAPVASLDRYATAQSIAAAAQADLSLIAQARYCWPSVRPDMIEIRYADMILSNSRAALPPACLPEPEAIRRIAKRTARRGEDIAPMGAFQAFVQETSYGKIEAEGCAEKLRDVPTSGLRRRWSSNVRIQRTGDVTIDGAFATILADPGFVSAMGRIKVSLVDANANVVVVRSLADACQPSGPAVCRSTEPSEKCQRDSEAKAREGLARTLSNGRTGYFPYASDFSTGYPIGNEVRGFTIGDDGAITGAVCLNFGPVSASPAAGQPGTAEQADAAACLLRALGIAGTRSVIEFVDMSPAEFRRRIPRLVGFDANRAFISRQSFDILKSLYADKTR